MERKELKVLNVEDSPEDSELLRLQLRREGFDAAMSRVQTSSEMEDALEREEWDIIITDNNLPEFSGMEALELLKASGRDIPIIILSGRIGDEKAVELMRAGAHDFIPKDNMARLVPSMERELREAGNRKARREDRKALEESQKKYATLVEGGNDGIVIQQDGRFMYANSRVGHMLGVSAEDMVGRSVFDFIGPGHREYVREIMQKRDRADPYPNPYEIELMSALGEQIPVEIGTSGTQYDGRPAIIAIIRDVRERKKTEELERRRARSEIFGFIASALPAFAESVSSQVREGLTKNFADNFERQMRSSFLEMDEDNLACAGDGREMGHLPGVFLRYLRWLKEVYSNLGVDVEVVPASDGAVVELGRCPWPEESRGNPIFCQMCRAMVFRSFTWTGCEGRTDQTSSVAAGGDRCRFRVSLKGISGTGGGQCPGQEAV